MVAVMQKYVYWLGKFLERLDRIPQENATMLPAWFTHKMTALGYNIRGVNHAGRSLISIPLHRGRQNRRSQAAIDAGFDDDTRTRGTHQGIPTQPPAVAGFDVTVVPVLAAPR